MIATVLMEGTNFGIVSSSLISGVASQRPVSGKSAEIMPHSVMPILIFRITCGQFDTLR